jgi:hypothetical protein
MTSSVAFTRRLPLALKDRFAQAAFKEVDTTAFLIPSDGPLEL